MAEIDDIREVAKQIKAHFVETVPNLPFLLFRIESISPNTQDNVFHAYCSMLEKYGSSKRIKHHIKIDLNTGKFLQFETVNEKEEKTEDEFNS